VALEMIANFSNGLTKMHRFKVKVLTGVGILVEEEALVVVLGTKESAASAVRKVYLNELTFLKL
jgi:hypothetical protein